MIILKILKSKNIRNLEISIKVFFWWQEAAAISTIGNHQALFNSISKILFLSFNWLFNNNNNKINYCIIELLSLLYFNFSSPKVVSTTSFFYYYFYRFVAFLKGKKLSFYFEASIKYNIKRIKISYNYLLF